MCYAECQFIRRRTSNFSTNLKAIMDESRILAMDYTVGDEPLFDASKSPNLSIKTIPDETEDKTIRAMEIREILALDKQNVSKLPAHKPECVEKREKREHSNSLDSEDSPRLSARKETARRQLLSSIYTKHKTVGRSFSFVAGEKRPDHIRFPRVFNNEQIDKHSRDIAARERVNANHFSTKSTSPHVKRRHLKTCHSTTTSGVDNTTSKPVHRTNSQKISLPDIIMDFNIEVNMAANEQYNDNIDADRERSERMIGASYEKYLKPKLSLNNPYNAKHRPVTPGLLDSLNKLKLPSKVKTERWLKDSQTVQKSYCAGSYRVGNLHSTNLTYPNWIYTDS